MAFVKRHKIVVGVLVVIALLFVNAFVFPFRAAEPNYSDVERVFNRMQFPDEWQEIRSSENRGLFGRKCPIEPGSRCFHKSKTFKIPDAVTQDDIKEILLKAGCPVVEVIDNTPQGSKNKEYSFKCSVEGLEIGADLYEGEEEAFVLVAT